MDAVEQAKSGHPGLPMGAADIATVLFTRFLKFDPADPHLAGSRPFRAVGRPRLDADLFAASPARLRGDDRSRSSSVSGSWTRRRPGIRRTSSRPGSRPPPGRSARGSPTRSAWRSPSGTWRRCSASDVVDHHTYVLASDGDLMEGISHEAIALAGHLKLNRLIVLFDDNGITIDGKLSLSDSVDQVKRFEAAGWAAARIDGHDPEAIAAAIEQAKTSDRPSLIACRTTIGYGAPTKAGTAKSHGSPLGAEEIAGAREKLGWSHAAFDVPADVREHWRTAGLRGQAARAQWRERLAGWRRMSAPSSSGASGGESRPSGSRRRCATSKQKLAAAPQAIATRAASEMALERPGAGIAGDDRRLGRSDRLEQYAAEGHGGALGRRLCRPLHPLRHPRARHGGGHERHGAAWRRHSVFRDIPRVLRLLPAGDPSRRIDGAAGHPCDDARLRSGSARTGRPTSRSSTWRPCGRCRTCWFSGPSTRSRRPNAGSSRCRRARRPSVLALTRQNLPQLRAGL